MKQTQNIKTNNSNKKQWESTKKTKYPNTKKRDRNSSKTEDRNLKIMINNK